MGLRFLNRCRDGLYRRCSEQALQSSQGEAHCRGSCSSPGGAAGGEGISRGATKQNTKNVWSRLGAL